MMQQKKIPEYEPLLLRMCGLCVKSEQCEADLVEKMRKAGAPAQMISRVIDYLYDNNFLNEERFAMAYASDKHRFNGWGRIKIRMMLLSKRLPAETVKRAIDSLDAGEYADMLRTLVRQKAAGVDLSDPVGRQKIVRSLFAKGYEPALTSKVIGEVRKSSEG